PNAVQCLPVLSDRRPRSHVLYPVRAIRRKNLGEAILLSLFLGPDRRVLVTQPPNSPADKASYRDWTAWVRRKRLPVDFEAGLEKDFLSLLKGADSVISTSVAEGFGLAFLEPWIAGRPMWGRRLDAICRDFEARGMRLDFLYDRLDVPTGWIDAERFARRWHQAVRRAAEGYRHVLSDTNAEKAYRRMTHGGRIDFGMLEEGFQRQVLTRLTGDRFARRALIRLNPWLENPGEIPNASTVIENNRRAAVQHYDSGGYRRRLLAIYRRVIDHPVRHRIDKKVLLAACFDLDRFSLLQWGAYAGE
ncbi:MAG TPA: hypothetical protein VLT88_08515, partial [Desulfosarcina sp.]|nr:hypothetical protein [Desulfosarcina sp.]